MTTPPDFESLYRGNPDPWQVGSRWYERRKLGIVAASLRRERYAWAWDAACGTGHLARRLSSVAERVLATDAAAAAIENARRTCSGSDNVVLRPHRVPDAPPEGGPFDLVVLSEFLYYLPERDRRSTVSMIRRVTAARAEIVVVHWRHRPHDAYISGAETQAEVVSELRGAGWQHPVHHLEDDFVLDIVEHADKES